MYRIPVGHRTRTQNSPNCRSERAVTLLLTELQAAGLKTVVTLPNNRREVAATGGEEWSPWVVLPPAHLTMGAKTPHISGGSSRIFGRVSKSRPVTLYFHSKASHPQIFFWKQIKHQISVSQLREDSVAAELKDSEDRLAEEDFVTPLHPRLLGMLALLKSSFPSQTSSHHMGSE